VGAYTYSVLKLGTYCPNGSKEIVAGIHNEEKNNLNTYSGDIAPNSQSIPSKTYLYFCMFTPSSGASMTEFPDFGITYGVFGGRLSPPSSSGHRNYWIQTGVVHTDDEDRNNGNHAVYPPDYTSDDVWDFTAGVDNTLGGNTNFYMAKVRVDCKQPAEWYDGSQKMPPSMAKTVSLSTPRLAAPLLSGTIITTLSPHPVLIVLRASLMVPIA
jgi:hypothetical protein